MRATKTATEDQRTNPGAELDAIERELSGDLSERAEAGDATAQARWDELTRRRGELQGLAERARRAAELRLRKEVEARRKAANAQIAKTHGELVQALQDIQTVAARITDLVGPLGKAFLELKEARNRAAQAGNTLGVSTARLTDRSTESWWIVTRLFMDSGLNPNPPAVYHRSRVKEPLETFMPSGAPTLDSLLPKEKENPS